MAPLIQAPMTTATPAVRQIDVVIGSHHLAGSLGVPPDARGVVVFAHDSGLSSRDDAYIAERLRGAGFATLLLDLLTFAEQRDRRNAFDIPLLASRLSEVVAWTATVRSIGDLPLGFFGKGTGAGAALRAASGADSRLRAIVSRGGGSDLAGALALAQVRAATLLITGSRDLPAIEVDEIALRRLRCENQLVLVPGAHHLFQEEGALAAVVGHARRWFLRHFDVGVSGDAMAVDCG